MKASGQLNAGGSIMVRGIEELGGVRWSYAVNSTELSSSDWRAQQSQASDFSHYHLLAARSEARARQTQGDVRLRLRSTADCGDFPFGH